MLLTDDTRDYRLHPTRQNMIAGMKWLVEGARPNDSLFIHCEFFFFFASRQDFLYYKLLDSGHGGQKNAEDDQEVDGLDEGKVLRMSTIAHCSKKTDPQSYFLLISKKTATWWTM